MVSNTFTVWREPWTFFTYPLVSLSGNAWTFINLLFALLWLYFVGTMLERRWGTTRFLVTFFVFSGLSAFFLSLGGLILGIPVGFGEMYLPLVALTVIWATLEPDTPVLLFIFPMRLGWLALITCLLLLFQYGSIHPLLGAFSLGGSLAAYLYTRYFDGIGRPRPPQYLQTPGSKPPGSGFFEWYRRWRFRRRFKKLWGE